jgi:predicted house-cleaning NTP pyrophosphatase (Maf/HAM1 superfamily)
LLGSGSATRKQILLENGFIFRVVKADIDEQAIGDRSKNAEDLVALLAREKAVAICHKLKLTNTHSWPNDLSNRCCKGKNKKMVHELESCASCQQKIFQTLVEGYIGQ